MQPTSPARASRTRALLVAAVAVALLLVLMPQAQALGTLTWTKLSPAAHPSARHWAAMAYDEADHELILFGGFTNGVGYLNDTWTWDGTNWHQESPSNVPPARNAASMVFDENIGKLIMFGGHSQSGLAHVYHNDMWAWTGSDWSQLTPETLPPARAWTGLASQPATDAVILYGGWDGGDDLSDTWSWNGVNWTELTPAHNPGARDDFAMVADEVNNKIVLFGGWKDGSGYVRDTWTWNGSDWTQAATTGPSPRADTYATYDERLGRVVLFGGYYYSAGTDTDIAYQDTWSWTGSAWTLLVPITKPSKRDSGSMAYFPPTGKTVLFGGYTENAPGAPDLGDTWVLNLGTATSVPSISTTVSATRTFTVSWGALGIPATYVVEYARRIEASGVWTTGPWTAWQTVPGTTHSAPFTGNAGSTYLFRAKANYAEGIATNFSSPVTAVVPYDDRATSIVFSSGWTDTAASSRYLNTLTVTGTANRTMTFKTDVMSFALIGDKCATCGKMKVYIDGVLVSTVDTYRSSTAVRQTLFTKSFSGSNPHTLKIVTLGTTGRPRIAIDAVSVKR